MYRKKLYILYVTCVCPTFYVADKYLPEKNPGGKFSTRTAFFWYYKVYVESSYRSYVLR